MPKYTIKDVIIDPEDPRLEGAIGKEVYHSNYPVLCLDYANEGSETTLGKLDNIYRKNEKPFTSDETAWICIIIKKEYPKPEYVPFSNSDEFINAYFNAISKLDAEDTETHLSMCGIWLFDGDCYVTPRAISDEGIFCGDDYVDWDDLLKGYEFLDCTPCGKIKEVENG